MMRSLMSAGFPVAQIMKTDVLEAIVHVPELHLRQIEIGMPARLHIDGLERQVETSVHILNDLVDPATHTVEVRLLIPNPDLAVKPGLFVKAELEPAPRTVRVIERGAVLGFGEERYVFVEQDSRAVRRPIRVRDLDLLRLEVLTGVEPGERALIGPTLPRVTDGTRVQVRPSANESPHVAL
jgi:membrane fusion protein (multidrug efflux system)